MNARTARRAGRAEWEQRSSVSHAEGAACGPFHFGRMVEWSNGRMVPTIRQSDHQTIRPSETRPTALRFLSGRAAPSPFFAPSRAALMCGNQVQQLGRIPEGAFLSTVKNVKRAKWIFMPFTLFTVPSLAGAPPARSRGPGKAKRLARRRDAGAQVAAHTRSAARPTGRRIVASETSPPGGANSTHPGRILARAPRPRPRTRSGRWIPAWGNTPTDDGPERRAPYFTTPQHQEEK